MFLADFISIGYVISYSMMYNLYVHMLIDYTAIKMKLSNSVFINV